jgi:phosphonate transport system ATP-binding protein
VSRATLHSSSNVPDSEAGQAAALLLDGVSKRFGPIEAVAPITLSVKQGETVALLGPSGGGKTTLLMMAAGEIGPSDGRVLLHGVDLAEMKPGEELARLVGMIHQQFDLVPNLSALHNVLAGRLGSWGLLKAVLSLVWPQERQAAVAALERVGVRERAELRAGNLSGGEQQRVALARLLMQNPAVVVADEPVSSLDPARAQEVVQLLVAIAREDGKTLVGSMHSLDLARAHFQRLVGLRNGVVQFDCLAAEVTDVMLRDLYDLRGLHGEH